MSLIAIALVGVAVSSLVDAQQACFLGYPSVPCPYGQDWRIGLLAVACVGVPLVWLIGLVGAAVDREIRTRRRRPH